jgi:phospholipid-translocating ATPase
LRLASYYRKFIKNYAEITSPLHAAINTEKNKLIWNSECDERFNLIKDLLCKAPVLRYPNFDKEFILDVDASFNSIGGILSQMDNNGNEHPIAYASRVLSSHEKGYCITRKELLALYEFMMYFKEYLYGKKFTARTDHKALTYMNKTKEPISPQFQTWFSNMSEFEFDLKYRKGELHVNADSMSRINEMVCAQCNSRHEGAKTEKSKVRYINKLDILVKSDRIIRDQKDSKKLWNV